MKKIKFLIVSFAAAVCTGFSSCNEEYDDSMIWDKVNELLNRVQKLEAACEQQNSNIAALQAMLNSLKDNVYVVSVEELPEGKGYTMKFSNDESINIYHGKQGDSPQITIVKEGDNYYWAVDGEILKDEDGNNVSADGDAENLPLLKTGSQLVANGVAGTWENDAVYVTTDNVTWTKINTGSANSEGSIFTSVETSENDLNVIVTLNDGSTIVLPKSNKMLQMLFGSWRKDFEGYYDIFKFNKDYTMEWDDGYDIMTGTFRFVPNGYVVCSFPNLDYPDSPVVYILPIVEVTEDTLIIGDDFADGIYYRIE